MVGKIFINYRREDSAPHALSVAQYLERAFGPRNVFIDIDRIRAGQNFHKVLEQRLSTCKVMIAVIGPNWGDVKNEAGQRRLDDLEDWVRLEIERALARGITVIPVLVGGAVLPNEADLPQDLKPLVRHHAAVVTTNGFRNEMAGLVRDIRGIPGVLPWRRISVGVCVAAVLIFASGAVLSQLGVLAKKRPLARSVDTAVSVLSPLRAGKPLTATEESALRSKDTFKECDDCPEMVVVPAGSFTMGSSEEEPSHFATESPQHTVTFARAFAVGRFAVTRDEFEAFVKETGHSTGDICSDYDDGTWRQRSGRSFRNPGFPQDGNHPVVCVNWTDAGAFARWLARKTGKTYRLLSEAEREYVTRAGTETPYWWATSISPGQANYNANYTYGGGEQGEYRQKTMPVHFFEPNPWGLYQVHGNVLEWLEDCWNMNHNGAPGDGSARRSGNCSLRVLRGGSWASWPWILRSASRYGDHSLGRASCFGLRVARAFDP